MSAEKIAFQKENRLNDLEDELATGDVIRDNLRRDKTKVKEKFVELLCLD